MSEHIYCGSGKEKVFENGGNILTITLNIDEILAQYSAYGFTTSAGKRTIKVKVGRRREVGQYGETHTVEIDTWKPEAAGNAYMPKQGQGSTHDTPDGKTQPNAPGNASALERRAKAADDDVFTDDIPF